MSEDLIAKIASMLTAERQATGSGSTAGGAAAPGRGGGRTSGRNNRSWGNRNAGRERQNTMPKTNVKATLPLVDKSEAFPQPGKYLSKVPSVEKNDPLYEEAYFPAPSDEFREMADRQNVFSTCQGFPILASEIYSRLGALSPTFTKVVPRCALDYYLAVLTYARILHIHHQNGNQLTYDEVEFVDTIINGKGIATGGYTIPKSFSMYLSGFGNTTVPGGRELQFNMSKPSLIEGNVSIDNHIYRIPGYFNKMEENVDKYMNYPCIAICIQRIYQDLAKSRNNNIADEWNLPQELIWSDYPLTTSCLGYSRATRISMEQQSFLTNAGFALGEASFANGEIALHLGIMNAVHQKLMGILPLQTKTIPVAAIGSQGQIPFETIAGAPGNGVENCTYIANSTLRSAASTGYLGSTFLYRMKFESRRLAKKIFPVKLPEATTIPDAQWEMLTSPFERTDGTINIARFQVVAFSSKIRVEQVVLKDCIAK